MSQIHSMEVIAINLNITRVGSPEMIPAFAKLCCPIVPYYNMQLDITKMAL